MPEGDQQKIYAEIGAAVEEIKLSETAAYFENKASKLEVEIEKLRKQLDEKEMLLRTEMQKREKAEGKVKYIRAQKRQKP